MDSSIQMHLMNHSDQIRSDPVRRLELKEVRAANAQKDDVLARKKLQNNTPEYYAVQIVDGAVCTHFSPKFSYLGCADSPEERKKLRSALLEIIRKHDGICAHTDLPM